MAQRKRVPMSNTRLARQAATAKGHTLTRFAVNGDGQLTASCKTCGKTVTAKVPGQGQKRFQGGALRLCVAAQPAPLPVFVTNQVQPVAPAPVASFPQDGSLVKRFARAFALGFSALVAPGPRQPVLVPVRQAA